MTPQARRVSDRVCRWRTGVLVRALLAAASLVLVASPAQANPRELLRRYDELDRKLSEATGGDYRFLYDEARRSEKRQAVLEAARELDGLLQQIEQVPDIGGLAQYRRVELSALRIALDDEEALRQWTERKENPGDPFGVCVETAVDYFRAADDAARDEVLARFETLLGQPATRHELAGVASFILSLTPPGPREDRVLDFIRLRLTSSTAAQVALRYEAARKLRASLGRPLQFRATTVDGKTVQAGDFRGKVLLLHFFATTNEPSMEEFRRLHRLYVLNRNRGLELVSVSCDVQKAAVTLMLDRNRRVTWPVLFDEFSATSSQSWHPLTLQLGVSKLPTLLLVDRGGVLRFADPEDLEAALRALLDEPAP